MIDPTALVAAFLVLTVVVLSVVGSRKIWRLRDEIGRLRKLEGTDDHPEHRCDRCGGRNLHCWCADSDVWNRFAGKFSVRVLCPICFSELVELAGVSNTIWRLSIEGDDPEISKVRVQLHARLEESAKLHQELEQSQAYVTVLEANLASPAIVALLRSEHGMVPLTTAAPGIAP